MPPNPTPYTYGNAIYSNGLSDERPRFPPHPHDWEPTAQARLSADSFGYLHGSAGTGQTDENNRAAFRRWGIAPSRLVAADYPDLRTQLFGEEYPYPIALAPVGVQKIFHRDGEAAVARAAAEDHLPYILSTAASMSIEEAAAANGDQGRRWFQLYWPGQEDNAITASLLHRAQAAGYTVLVVTLDTYILGWRPSDLGNAYNPFLRADNVGVEIGFSDPVWRRRFREQHGMEVEEDLGTAAKEWAQTVFPGKSHGWEDLQFLKEHWKGPIVLKGIQTVRDAQLAVQHGMDGIVVSNHGGRQQDGGVASLDVLPEIVDAVGEQIEVLFDSGVRCGADIVKALALGAKMVLIGRPYVYGLAMGGQAGVSHVLKCLLGDLDLTLHLSGVPSVKREHLNRSILREVK
ncbi:lactate 2-monooxygenase [Aspergillus saccharolyticus JOP 1030-1]|uniref:Putative FMN dependent dehydrogenase n=1 Tax=Aspergillus saccharolyticus JOP 1030-1 TaxID=1450539 RepID=A0A318Z360_9EURO|nr:putative FMN dependent dehydrogenase [Aspergillus saccharolyticus JOP 1030-1]PYH40824.1 putative FMN dependent dehydrogenase [Aspergillus saccharolyticus JOP 1030-1]